MPNDMSEEEFKDFFIPHGEFTEVFINSQKGFGFIRMVRKIQRFCCQLIIV
jgi:proline- and glutamine-rich splicing factor